MAAKTLNLDQLAADKKTVTLGGREYAIKEMSVEDFIEASKAAAEAEAKGIEASVAENVEGTISNVKRALPDVPVEVLRALSVVQLVALVQFINGSLEGEVKAGEQASGN